jgi:hypothetical protein
MAADTTSPRSRRALLAAGAGAVAATAAQAMGGPLPARAAAGNFDSSTVGIPGVLGTHWASSGFVAGVAGVAASPEGPGVYGRSDALSGGVGVLGHAADAGAGTGVLGWVGLGVPSGLAKTGVFGYSAIDTAAVGVGGESPAGTGVQAASATGNALRVSGKARFNRSGKVSVPKSRNYVDVTVPGGIASNTVVNATIQMYRAGVAVAGVRLNYPISGKARIYLTKVASTTSSTPVAWMAIEYGS